ncbi:alpha-mannosidase, partial [Streptomyces sp. SID7982]|nr:alpha-mannosidase [Streptomyces sp. SID7982]
AAEEEYGERAPVWSGELYLELHRATYTTQAKTKQGNRRSEHLLREAELWATAAALRSPARRYPYERLDRVWKTVLLHQFHDILPGSSIAWVHREARDTYEEVRAELADLVAEAVTSLGAAEGLVALNSSPYERVQVIELDAEAAGVLPSGAHVQELGEGRAAVLARSPGLGAGLLDGAAVPEHAVTAETSDADAIVLDNGLLRIVVDGDGLVSSVHDLVAGREVLVPGARANLLQLHPDHPNHWDAWDIDRHYQNTRTDLTDADSVTLVE